MSKYERGPKPLPFYIIKAATEGDEDAINDVIKHFSNYIITLSSKELFDESGNAYICIDETLCTELTNKLIQGIYKFKIR